MSALLPNISNSRLGSSLVEVYKIGSLAHGGFSQIYSDIDVGLILGCPNPPGDMDRMITVAKALDDQYGKKLSIFWGNPEYSWGRLPALDRLDLLDHGVPLLNNRRAGVSATHERRDSSGAAPKRRKKLEAENQRT